jgi:hypothetical protein
MAINVRKLDIIQVSPVAGARVDKIKLRSFNGYWTRNTDIELTAELGFLSVS